MIRILCCFFKVPRNWTSVGFQQDPHETFGNGLNTTTESPLQVSAASRRHTTRGDERGLCFRQRFWGEKSHELSCQWSFLRLRTKDRSCHLGLAQKMITKSTSTLHICHIYIYIYINVALILARKIPLLTLKFQPSLSYFLWWLSFSFKVGPLLTYSTRHGMNISHSLFLNFANY